MLRSLVGSEMCIRDRRRKSSCSAEFHMDTGLSLMHDPVTDGERRYRVVVDRGVLVGILDHAYSDPINEIIGHLGGTYDERLHTAHVTHYSPSCREIAELRPDSVEGQVTEQHVASERFQEAGVSYLGWYHSHPRIKPFPSFKDLEMQSEMQSQVPHSLGLICSSWWPPAVLPNEGSQQLTHYFSAFRIRRAEDGVKAVKVTWGIAHQDYMPPCVQASMSHTVETILKEAQDTREWRKAQCGDLSATSAFVDLEFDAFLAQYLRETVTQHVLALEQDLQALSAFQVHQLKRLGQLQAEAQGLKLPGLADFRPEQSVADRTRTEHPQVIRLFNRPGESVAGSPEQVHGSPAEGHKSDLEEVDLCESDNNTEEEQDPTESAQPQVELLSPSPVTNLVSPVLEEEFNLSRRPKRSAAKGKMYSENVMSSQLGADEDEIEEYDHEEREHKSIRRTNQQIISSQQSQIQIIP
eukprot:TRINITY_DN27744_c0_g1_i4.p1 TRINITY_DN27744_c0_g1~~TRINITY_DN27744_c0_g1_i4.p1  ORF type:complete len:467 (+),score=106.23 TRINITY_DN27744_c0_g1_i4:135-1535(+)